MKRTISILALVLAAVMLMMCFAACGEEDKKDSADGGAVSIDGTYKLVELVSGGQDMTDQISMMESAGMSIDLVINGDKATLMGQEVTLKDGKMSANGEDVPYTVSGGKITIEKDGDKMVFEKK